MKISLANQDVKSSANTNRCWFTAKNQIKEFCFDGNEDYFCVF